MIDDFSRPPEPRRAKMGTFQSRTPSRPDGQSFDRTSNTRAKEDNQTTPAFQPPEQVSAEEEQIFLPPLEHHEAIAEHASEPKSRRFFGLKKPNLTKKQWIIVGAVFVLLVGGGAAFALTRDKPEPVVKKAPAKVEPAPPPKPILSPLTGIPVSADQQKKPVTGIMIENSTDARPQSGLKEAGIVFEAIAEYGITRFLALFQEAEPSNIGPVRSARPYYLDWVMSFDANYAHVGGSPDALARIKEIGVRDLDQFYNAGAYRRASHRFAPHNVYTSMGSLHAAANAKGLSTSTFTPLKRVEKETPSKAPTAKSIDLAISSATYNVHYDYNPATNSYKRSMGGAIHLDAESKLQIEPKVVVALAMPYSLMADGYHSQYATIGSGNMLLFQDGIVTAGTWAKPGVKDQFIFKDGAGEEIKLNPGQTWITVLGDITQAKYAP